MALNALWKSMTTPEPVVHVLSASAHPTQDKIIVYVDDEKNTDETPHWVGDGMCFDLAR